MIQSLAMPSALAARPPRFLGAVPVALLDDCTVAETVLGELHTAGATLEPVAPAVFSTLLDVPKGERLRFGRPMSPLARASKTAQAHRVVRDALLRKDLVYSPRRGLIDFTVLLFGEYLRRQYPLSGFDEE